MAGSNGSITGTLGQTVAYGSDCTPVTAVPATNYLFTGWTGGHTGSENPLTVTNVTSDLTVTANFVKSQYTITVTAGTGGSITPAGPVTVDYGASSPEFQIVPSTGYKIIDVLVNGQSIGLVATYTFTNVTTDNTISASFDIETNVLDEDENETTRQFCAAPIPAVLNRDEIRFAFRKGGNVTAILTIFDCLGNTVLREKHHLRRSSNSEKLEELTKWDLLNRQGQSVTSGTYLAKLEVTDTKGSKKVYTIKIGIKE